MNPQRPESKTRDTPLQALPALQTLLALLMALAVHPAAAAPMLAACSWNQPGHNPFTGDVLAAVDRYPDIAPATRARLKARMARRDYDEIVTIGRDAIVGRARYGAEIRDMHFGADQVCRTVNRSAWAANAQERGLVYCEAGQCILVPTVCRNVSRIGRIGQEEPTVAGVAETKFGTPGGSGGSGGSGIGGGGTAVPSGPTDARAAGATAGDDPAPLESNGAAGTAGPAGAVGAAGSGFGGAGAAAPGGPGSGMSAGASWVQLGGALLPGVPQSAGDTRQGVSPSPGADPTGGGLPSGGAGDIGGASLLNPVSPPVPEPGSLAMWTAALLVLGWRVRRVQRSPSAGNA